MFVGAGTAGSGLAAPIPCLPILLSPSMADWVAPSTVHTLNERFPITKHVQSTCETVHQTHTAVHANVEICTADGGGGSLTHLQAAACPQPTMDPDAHWCFLALPFRRGDVNLARKIGDDARCAPSSTDGLGLRLLISGFTRAISVMNASPACPFPPMPMPNLPTLPSTRYVSPTMACGVEQKLQRAARGPNCGL